MHCRVELARCHKRLGNLETAIELLRYGRMIQLSVG
jgi:hypothetical protein